MTVTPLHNANDEPDETVVQALEHALKLAQSGELRSVVIAGDLVGNRTYTNFVTHDLLTLMGMLAFLQQRVASKKEELADG